MFTPTTTTNTTPGRSVRELVDWAMETGRMLPMPPAIIADLERQGHVVDLDTGHVALFGAIRPAGEAVFVPAPIALAILNLLAAVEQEVRPWDA